MKILVLGVTGMLGHSLFGYLGRNARFQVFGTCRSRPSDWLPSDRLSEGVSTLEPTSWHSVLADLQPDIVINCIGVIKQLKEAKDPIVSIQTNALFPHQLHGFCRQVGARLVHFSTDCVFSGRRGGYTESDLPDPTDLYGRTKLLGEIDNEGALTLRTSIIGHGVEPNRSLIDWFLSQGEQVSGYTRAIYSGFPTVEIARVVQDVVIPRADLSGLYHLSSDPISKYDLLKEVAAVYDKEIEIVPDSSVPIDRSLDSAKFRSATGYCPPKWPALIQLMRNEYLQTGALRCNWVNS